MTDGWKLRHITQLYKQWSMPNRSAGNPLPRNYLFTC